MESTGLGLRLSWSILLQVILLFSLARNTTLPQTPNPTPTSGFDASLLQAPALGETTTTTAVLKVCPCLIDQSGGTITMAGLIVCNRDNTNCNMHDLSGVMTWKRFKDNGYNGSYRPTSDDWHKSQDFETDDGVTYTLGGDVTCEQQRDSVYCNGPLPSGTKLVVKVFVCTNRGCILASSGITIVTSSGQALMVPTENQERQEGKVNAGVIVVPILGVIGLTLLIVLHIVYLRRHKRLHRNPQSDAIFSSHILVSLPELKTDDWPSVPLFHFDEYLRQMHLDANRRFKSEFTELCATQQKKASQFTVQAGNEPLNVIKNRSSDVLPYDHTRVVLSGRRDNTQDYINASYVQGRDSPCGYIATQGPLYSTLSDFWKMICEQRSRVIVMLCDCIEDGKKTVDQYWPDKINSPLQHGDVTVTMTSMSDFTAYTLRELTARMAEREDLQVTQLCVRGWSEVVCSLPFEKLIEVVRLARQAARHSSGPITVHCNLGIRRTGMFIAFDLLTYFVDEHGLASEVNVYSVVERMLGCRRNIIQTLDQYMFIHDVLRVIIARKMRSDSGRGTSDLCQNRGQTDIEYERVYSHMSCIRECETYPNENIYCTLP